MGKMKRREKTPKEYVMFCARSTSKSSCRHHLYFLLAVVAGASLSFIMTSSEDMLKVQGSKNSCQVLLAKELTNSQPHAIAHMNIGSQTVPVGPNNKVLSILRDMDQRHRLILVGVMTAQKYLDTRATAVYRTWAHSLDGHVVFFTSWDVVADPELPIVRLPTVDDTYPPQKKSFLMLKYIGNHFVDRYEWFMRADDDVYVRGDKLGAFLRSINSSKPQFIGQAGTGNKEEFGQLNLEPDENFCMGGPGIVFSRETLKSISSNVRHCLKNLYSTHEDVEVGRCVRTFAGIPCTWSYEMQTIFYHNSSGNEAFTGSLKQKEIQHAITLHPIKQHHHFYRLHNHFLSLKQKEILQSNLFLHRDIRNAMSNLGMSHNSASENEEPATVFMFSNSWEEGKGTSLMRTKPENDSEVLKWDFIHKAMYSFTHSNPRRKVDAVLSESLDSIIGEIMDLINQFSKQRGRVIDFKDILYAYQRLDPQHGADYILDMLLVYKKYRGRKLTLPVRKHVYVQQTFTDLQVKDLTTSEEKNKRRLNFILPLSGRWKIFQRFISNFEEVCLTDNQFSVTLSVIIFPEPNTTSSMFQEALGNLKQKYGELFYLTELPGSFSRAVALNSGASRFASDELLLFIDVDMHFDSSFLNRVLRNTALNKQAYFPIVFSQYDPLLLKTEISELMAKSAFQIDSRFGYWRVFGFGIASLYRADLDSVGGMDTGIQGWGKEDVDLYDKVLRSNISAFRTPDTGLFHIFHPIECDEALLHTQLIMCEGSKASSYASIDTLSEIIYNQPKLFQSSSTLTKVLDEDDIVAIQR